MNRMTRCTVGAAALYFVSAAPSLAATNCNLGNGIKHVFHLTFDNVHLRRDMPNVPSDLEQIPSLLAFLQDKGVILNNHHTPLISHTADYIITAVTGVYGARHGQPVANTFGQFDSKNPNVVHNVSSFVYWTTKTPNGTPATTTISWPLVANPSSRAIFTALATASDMECTSRVSAACTPQTAARRRATVSLMVRPSTGTGSRPVPAPSLSSKAL